MIQILYQDDHLNRAKTLAKVYPKAKYDLITKEATHRFGLTLDTLVFWGHSGGNLSLCGKTPAEIAKITKKWKLLNCNINTVEILTCDGRHAQVGSGDPLVRQIKNALNADFFTRNIVVKALPVAVAGSTASASILLADWETDSWCYISAPSPQIMFETKNKIEAIALKFYRLRENDKSAADVAKASERLFKQEGEKNRKYSLNYGYFKTLRSHLGVVRATDFTIASRLHKFDPLLLHLDELDDLYD